MSIEFLRRLHPSRWWVLSAIEPNGEAIETRSFLPAEDEAAARFIEANHQRGWNQYYTLNAVGRRLWKKPTKGDITQAVALHVDIDPRPGHDLLSEQSRIEKLLCSLKLPSGLPRPTWVLFSGGGYQALWILVKPINTTSPEIVESIESRNRFIEQRLGGDSCHNIDRVLRLPGTWNFPSDKKAQAGRVPALAGEIPL